MTGVDGSIEASGVQSASRHGGRLYLSIPGHAHLVSAVFLAAAVGLLPWMVFLGLSLPPQYDAGHWNLL